MEEKRKKCFKKTKDDTMKRIETNSEDPFCQEHTPVEQKLKKETGIGNDHQETEWFEEFADVPLICPKCLKTFGAFKMMPPPSPNNESSFFCLCPHCGERLTYEGVREKTLTVVIMWALFMGLHETNNTLFLGEFMQKILEIPKSPTLKEKAEPNKELDELLREFGKEQD